MDTPVAFHSRPASVKLRLNLADQIRQVVASLMATLCGVEQDTQFNTEIEVEGESQWVTLREFSGNCFSIDVIILRNYTGNPGEFYVGRRDPDLDTWSIDQATYFVGDIPEGHHITDVTILGIAPTNS